MRYWWVNQKQTNRYEIAGGYLWSPKANRNGARNPFYETMREVAPGDVVLSYFDGQIAAIGLARSYGYTAPKPDEFGNRGAYWDLIGWRVDVDFTRLPVPLRPANVMDVLGPLMPERYAPLRANGLGLQNLYLTALPVPFAHAVLDLLGPVARSIVDGHLVTDHLHAPTIGLEEWEDHEEEVVRSDASVTDTTRMAIIQARRGQGAFKQQVQRLEKRCGITGVERIEHLRASHCKPWRDATNDERLDGENGLLLTPTIDHLFDRGFIGFENDGTLIVSPVADRGSLARKTTFARAFLPEEAHCPRFINADLIAAGLSPFEPETAAVRAARVMLEEIDGCIARGESFAFETTLAGRAYFRRIAAWRAAG